MNPASAILCLLAIAVLAGTARTFVTYWRTPTSLRPAAWRMGALLVLQLAGGALLYCTLLPPQRVVDGSTLVVLTAGADAQAARAAAADGAIVVALPEAGAIADAGQSGIERMPDLGTALRAHPGTSRLLVTGTGLAERDIDAANGLPLHFEPAPLPRGLVELRSPARVVAGGNFRVSGRTNALEGGRIELVDPAGAVQDRATLDGDGRFLLQGTTRVAGPASYRLHLHDGSTDAGLIEDAELAVEVVAGTSARLLLLAGAPGPEVKYLRRWATDAGLHLHSRMALGAGVMLGDGPPAFDATTLAGFDLAIVDERAWQGLAAGQREALLAAVDQGLGLMMRITAPPDASTHTVLRQLGFALAEDDGLDAGVVLDVPAATTEVPVSRAGTSARPAVPGLLRQPVSIDAAASLPLLRDAAGETLARWRSAGRGRIAVWNLDQSFRLVLGGHGDLHARLWSEAVGTLARARDAEAPRLVGIARQGRRAILCGLAADSVLVADDGTRLHPQPDPGARGCAAVWPVRAGWHRTGEGDSMTMLHVSGSSALPAVEALARREATQRLADFGTMHVTDAPTVGPAAREGARWPWFLAWLVASGLLWWLERFRDRPSTARSGSGMDQSAPARAPGT